VAIGKKRQLNGNRVGNGKLDVPIGKTRAKPPVKFKDDKGNTWTGRVVATPNSLAAYEAEAAIVGTSPYSAGHPFDFNRIYPASAGFFFGDELRLRNPT
jgi:hypothetical protein